MEPEKDHERAGPYGAGVRPTEGGAMNSTPEQITEWLATADKGFLPACELLERYKSLCREVLRLRELLRVQSKIIREKKAAMRSAEKKIRAFWDSEDSNAEHLLDAAEILKACLKV